MPMISQIASVMASLKRTKNTSIIINQENGENYENDICEKERGGV